MDEGLGLKPELRRLTGKNKPQQLTLESGSLRKTPTSCPRSKCNSDRRKCISAASWMEALSISSYTLDGTLLHLEFVTLCFSHTVGVVRSSWGRSLRLPLLQRSPGARGGGWRMEPLRVQGPLCKPL